MFSGRLYPRAIDLARHTFNSGPSLPHTGSLRGRAVFGMEVSAFLRSATEVHSSYVPVGG